MKTKYISPIVAEQAIQNRSVVCGSGEDRVSSNVDIHGGDQSGDQSAAF